VIRTAAEGTRRRVFVAFAVAAAVALAIALAVPPRREPLISLSAEPRSKQPELASARSSEPAVVEPPAVARDEKRVAPRLHGTASAPSARPSAAPESAPPSLSEEIAVLDRARGALGADPARTLSVLDEYEHALHGTRLVAEAALLRIEALARSGQGAAASDLARRFVEANPGSALSERAKPFVTAPAGGASSPGVDAGGKAR
jgi:hypothetical protein